MRYGQEDDDYEDYPPEDEGDPGEDASIADQGPPPSPDDGASAPEGDGGGGGGAPMPVPVPIPYAPATDAYFPPGAAPKRTVHAIPHSAAHPAAHKPPPVPRRAVVHPHHAPPKPLPHVMHKMPVHPVMVRKNVKFRGDIRSELEQHQGIVPAVGGIVGWALSRSLWGMLIGAIVGRAVSYRRAEP